MTAKRPPWILIWGRYLLVLAVVFVLSLGRKAKPAFLVVWRAFLALGSLPFTLMNEITDMQMRRVAAEYEQAALLRQMQEQAQAVNSEVLAWYAQATSQVTPEAVAQQQALLQNVFTQYLGRQSNGRP